MSNAVKLQNYIASNGDVIAGANGEQSTLPNQFNMGSFWNHILPDPNNPSMYIPTGVVTTIANIRGGVADRWMRITRRYNHLVERFEAALLLSWEGNPTPEDRISFIASKKANLKSKMSSVKNRLIGVAYRHNSKIINMRASL